MGRLLMGLLLCWLVGRDPTKERMSENRQPVPLQQVYTTKVRNDLHAVEVAPSLDPQPSPVEWNAQLVGLENLVLGLVLVRSGGLNDPLLALPPDRRAVLDYWNCTAFFGCPMVIIDVPEVCPATPLTS